MLSRQLLDFLSSHILQTIYIHFFLMFLYICIYVVNTVFYVINVALPLTQCIGYNCAIKYSGYSSFST